MQRKRADGFGHIGLVIIIVVIAVIGMVGWRVSKQLNKSGGGKPSEILRSNDSSENKAVKAGKHISGNRCSGTEKLTFTHLPMKESDFSIIVPYGLVVGYHVTPIDHQYFSPASYNSPRDAYPVYAMADAQIVDIQPRTNNKGTEYRFVFAHSCTSLYYYDLVTSLSGKVKEAYEKNRSVNMPIKAGEQVGMIGGQTLDFAYWDTDKPLTGFVNPASYDGEAWKIFTADPLPMYTPELRVIVEARNPRTVEPRSGKIDHDIDGKLVGNWFVSGSGGYSGTNQGRSDTYASTHLSIAPNLYDPTHFNISIGDFGGNAEQFAAKGNAPDPATVSKDTGLVKYELQKYSYLEPSGAFWDNKSLIKGPKVKNVDQTEGCLLVQMIEDRQVKAEPFVKKSCSAVAGFTSSAKVYAR